MGKEALRIAIAQINVTVGDLEGNSQKITQCIQRLKGFGVDIISFPELSLTGYPPEDLLLKSRFISNNLDKLSDLAKSIDDIVAIVGFVDRQGKNIYNAAAVIYKGKIRGVYRKVFLPNYGVFDEKRYFTQGQEAKAFKIGKVVFGVTICEDIWYENGPVGQQANLGAKLIININASPYYAGKARERQKVIQKQAKSNNVFIAYANLVGGQDELVFDGASMIADNKGNIVSRLEAFKEDLLLADLAIPTSIVRRNNKIISVIKKITFRQKALFPKRGIRTLEPIAEVYQALILGLRDYINKNGFCKVAIGLSGGIDSSLVASLAVDALGKENVFGVFMPSRYSSGESKIDATQLAERLGIKLMNVSIEQLYKMYLMALEPYFLGSEKNTAEENLQARIRGNILMALSNKFGWLILATGNKSEMSVGYATLYGDMAGGFAVIKDVPKTLVYKLARYRNSLSFVIPERVLIKEPTAELRPNQKDKDTLPNYGELDQILKAYVEEDRDLSSIISQGFDRGAVTKVLNMVDKNEYKRRQSPPGIKITPKALGRDRRMPITNRYRG